MLQTLKEGSEAVLYIKKRIKKTYRQIFSRLKKKFKKAFILSLSLRLLVVTIPVSAMPALAFESALGTNHNIPAISLSKNQAVFDGSVGMVNIVPGDSNATIDDQKKQEEAAQARSKARLVQKISNPVPDVQSTELSIDDLRTLYSEAGSAYGVPPALLEAIHQVESGKSGDTSRTSSAGAVGPMQFLRSTFNKYASPGGVITSVHDSVFAAARLLSAARGEDGSWDPAILSYNHSRSYLTMVLNVANSLGAGIN